MVSPINKKSVAALLKASLVAVFCFSAEAALAQIPKSEMPDSARVQFKPALTAPETKVVSWFEKISLRGYVQVRYNRLLETNENLKSEHDKSIGKEGGFLIRRARLVFSGNVHERVYIYIQPDFASSPSSSSPLHFAQIRDAYFDLSLDKEKEYRLRVGQSKIPFGFENLQSSQNRLTLDRNDALNSAVPNERDLGMFFYWAPAHIRKRFSELGNSRYKGSGDYGVFGLGVYNGQTANKKEANDNQHIVARLTYPFAIFNDQILEPGVQGYTGTYTVTTDQLSNISVKGDNESSNFRENRVAGSLLLYPKPFGFQAEFNVGEGPVFDPETRQIKIGRLHGGYAQAMYHLEFGKHDLMPFAKVQYYKGGKKAEMDARYAETYETEIGVEWRPFSNFELVAQYTIADRLTQDGRNLNNRQWGNLLRLQAQFNF